MNEYPVCDLHCDTILELRNQQEEGKDIHLDRSDLCVSLKKLKEGNVCIQTFGLFADRKTKRSPEHEALSVAKNWKIWILVFRPALSEPASYA